MRPSDTKVNFLLVKSKTIFNIICLHVYHRWGLSCCHLEKFLPYRSIFEFVLFSGTTEVFCHEHWAVPSASSRVIFWSLKTFKNSSSGHAGRLSSFGGLQMQAMQGGRGAPRRQWRSPSHAAFIPVEDGKNMSWLPTMLIESGFPLGEVVVFWDRGNLLSAVTKLQTARRSNNQPVLLFRAYFEKCLG